MSLISKINTKGIRTFFLRAVAAIVALIHVVGMCLHYFLGQAIDHVLFQTNAQLFYWIVIGTVVDGVARVPEIRSFVGATVGRLRGKKKPGDAITQEEEETASDEAKHPEEVLYKTAKQYIGVEEVAGAIHNKTIMSWIDKLNFKVKFGIDSDEIPWCGTMACGCADEAGLEHPGSANAKQWQTVGERFEPGKTEVPAGIYGIVAVSHRKYISQSLLDGPGHVEIVDPTSFKPDGTYKTIAGNLNRDKSKGKVGVSIRNTNDPMFIGFFLLGPS